MIDLGSIAGLHERQHEMRCYCARCQRWRTLDLRSLISRGRGNQRVPFRVRCTHCGERGQMQIRPVMPAHSTANGWVMPSAF